MHIWSWLPRHKMFLSFVVLNNEDHYLFRLFSLWISLPTCHSWYYAMDRLRDTTQGQTQTKKRTQASPGIARSRWVWVKETQNTARYGLSAQLHSPSRKPCWRPMSQLLATFHCCNQFPWPKAIKSLFLLTVPEGQTSIMVGKARQWEQEEERSHLRKQSSNWKWGQATNTKSPPPESKPPPPKGSTTSTNNSANVGVTPRVEVHKHGRHLNH